MKAIDTEYNSILFRSRLEARWAILFDQLKIKWVYEPDCFELSNGTRYTPDFYIEKYKLFVEIKPNLDWLNDDYHLSRYKCFDENLIILSDSFPDFTVNKLYHFVDGEKYENTVVFCPNSKYEPFFYSGYGLLNSDDSFSSQYEDELNFVKKYRFWK